MVISSPGAIAPDRFVALLVTGPSCGTGRATTVNVTFTTIGFASTPGALMEMVPLSVPALRPAGFTETVSVCVVLPELGVADNQPPVLVAPTLICTGPPVLVTCSVCDGGDE